MNSYPCYDMSDEAYARLNVVIEIMNKPHEHFPSDMRDFSLLHEIEHSLPIPRLESISTLIISLLFPSSLMLSMVYL